MNKKLFIQGTDRATVALMALLLPAAIFTACLVPDEASAKVTGECVNCHTMHDSQDGTAISATPNQYLTVKDCVGCHSSDTGETIITMGATRIPIVFNTGGYPAQPLAGGNFYYTSQSGTDDGSGYDYESYGHNVKGITTFDSVLFAAPGGTNCISGCHITLAYSPYTTPFSPSLGQLKGGGCTGCHIITYHHTDNNVYRFLDGHWSLDYHVEGVEDPDWEQNPSFVNSNKYKGDVSGDPTFYTDHTISGFCGGCHDKFHEHNADGNIGIGTASPWLRHPTDIALPTANEYGNFDPTNAVGYSNLTPVAYTDPTAPTRATAVVMCLSCHRTHGSQYPDMLRWDYQDCQAGTDNSNCGCFNCHTTKDAG